MLPGLLEGPLVEVEIGQVVVDGGLRGIGRQRPFVGLEGEAQVLLSRGLVLPLFKLAGPLLVGEGEVLQRHGVIGEETFQRAEDLDGQLRIAVPGLQDAQVGELRRDIGLDREDEPPVVVRVRILGVPRQHLERAGNDGLPAQLLDLQRGPSLRNVHGERYLGVQGERADLSLRCRCDGDEPDGGEASLLTHPCLLPGRPPAPLRGRRRRRPAREELPSWHPAVRPRGWPLAAWTDRS